MRTIKYVLVSTAAGHWGNLATIKADGHVANSFWLRLYCRFCHCATQVETVSRLGQQEAPNYTCYSLFLLARWFSQTSWKYRVKVSLGPLPLPTTYGLILSLFPNTLMFYFHTTDLLTTLSCTSWFSVAVLFTVSKGIRSEPGGLCETFHEHNFTVPTNTSTISPPPNRSFLFFVCSHILSHLLENHGIY